jgi:L,D-transpeptidase YcbB
LAFGQIWLESGQYRTKDTALKRKVFRPIAIAILGLGIAAGPPLYARGELPANDGIVLRTVSVIPAGSAAETIRNILRGTQPFESAPVAFSQEVQRYYAARHFRPVWSSGQRLLPIAGALERTIEGIGSEGLDPQRAAYHLARIRPLLQDTNDTDPRRLAQTDLLLTDAFFALGHDLHYGMAYGQDLNATHEFAARPVEMTAVLDKALSSGNVKDTLLALAPHNPDYLRLKKALASYRTIAREGGWSTHAADYAETAVVRTRLAATGDLNVSSSDPESLRAAVERFQKRHGIAVDGVVGPVTASAMAVAPSALIEKIKLNMERWKWLPPDESGQYIMVNIPGFKLEVCQDGKRVLDMQAIVGRLERKTPTFTSKLRYIVFNPYWRVPETILNEDLVPKLQADPDYLAAKRIRIFAAGDGKAEHPIDPRTIDWKQWQPADSARYFFREEPGKNNPMGYVKFLFPNPYDVYIHDTPSSSLFKNSNATFSSGCIRVRKPVELAHYLLASGDPSITYKAIFSTILEGENRWIQLKHPIDVYITYQTARVGGDGLIYFYNDIYGYDRRLMDYLNKN